VFIDYLPSCCRDPSSSTRVSLAILLATSDLRSACTLTCKTKEFGCWFAPNDMKIGDRIRDTIDESIRFHDKLLLVLSESSISSQWVETEVETALEHESRGKATLLFPIRLDEAVMENTQGVGRKYPQNSTHRRLSRMA